LLNYHCFSLYLLLFLMPFFSPESLQDKDPMITLGDPSILYHNKTYYLYGTGGSKKHPNGFVVYTSKDLKSWTGPAGADDGYVLKKGSAFGTSKFWAPQVFQHKGMFYMAYAADERIAIAKGKSPLGPFTQDDHLPISDKKQIDPFVFFDEDGKIYMYHVVVGNGANRIFVAEMNDQLSAVKDETIKECISFTDKWENTENEEWSVIEGPTVLKRNGLYYLIYSANHFKSKDYSVGYATSKSPVGPWKKYTGNPIISRNNIKKSGSGHGDLFKDEKGNFKYVLHTHFSDSSIAPRLTGIVDLSFKQDKIESIPGSFYYLKSNSPDIE
jgi:beta-xylosidase